MLISLTVKTKQRESSIEKISDNEYKVSVKSLPTKNKANIEVIDILSKYVNVTKSQVRIKGGKYTNRKVVYIDEQIGIGM
jgi:uncharacterized protein YggU (UPF0235/DUF167 family)